MKMTTSSVTTPQRVKYVFIPCDNTESIEELEFELPPGKECESFLDHLKKHFCRSGGGKTAAQKAAHRKAILDQLGPESAGKIDQGVLEAATDLQMVENIALLPNSPASNYVAVNLYCDDEAQIKNLPLNPRASQIACCCGRMLEVRGDAFLARVFDNEDDFKRIDFTLSEVSSSAPWVVQAAEYVRRQESRGPAEALLNKMSERQKQAGSQAQVVELSPAEAAKDEGNKLFAKGQWAAAADQYSRALELDPALSSAANNRAMARLKLGQWEGALQDCCKVLAAEPSNVKALLRRAAAATELHQNHQAEEDLKAALQLQPTNKEALQRLQALQQAAAAAAATAAAPAVEQVAAAPGTADVEAMST